MRLHVQTSLFFAMPVIAVACGAPGSQDKGFASSTGGGDDAGAVVQDSGSPGTFGNGNPSSSSASGNIGMYVPPTQLGCSSRAQSILILDFRSGWWAGGGGGTFTSTALGAVIGACDQTMVDYHHFETQMHVKCVYKAPSGGTCSELTPAVTVQDIESSFEKPSVSDYTQIWVLSGSDQDQSDIPVGDALFQGVMADTKGACIPMLIAAGDGFITHANTITQDWGMGTVFTAQTNPPGFFESELGVGMVSSIGGSEMTPHLLFTNVTSIADKVASVLQSSHGDSLAASVPAPAIYNVIAHDGAGNPSVAVGAAKVTGDGYRPFVFDSGWQRMYVLNKDAGTGQYLKNLVMYLGLVGCKAAPIGPVTSQ